MSAPKFMIRSDKDYYEFDFSYCYDVIKQFKRSHFRKNSKKPAKIYAKVFHPPDCPEHFWMYYLVFEKDGKIVSVDSIKKEAFDVLTEGVEPSYATHVEFYTIAKRNAG
jgi:hypothetical protein